MRRFVVGGLLIELALLIIGLTWIAPIARSGEDGAAPGASAASDRYRMFDGPPGRRGASRGDEGPPRTGTFGPPPGPQWAVPCTEISELSTKR